MASSLFFFNDTATTEIYTLSLHDALPIYLELLGPLGARDDEDAVRRLAERPDHLVVVLVADENDRVVLARVADRLEVHLGHERARRIDNPEAPLHRLLAHLRRDPVRAEDHGRVVRHLVQLVHEDGALGAELFDNVAVMDDLFSDGEIGRAHV